MTTSVTEDVKAEAYENVKKSLLRGTIWVCIGALISSALICVYWVLTGEQSNIIWKAFFTVGLLASFSLIVLVEVKAAAARPQWYTISSLAAWIVLLILGAMKIWWEVPIDTSQGEVWEEFQSDYDFTRRFILFLVVIGIIRLALVIIRQVVKMAMSNLTMVNKVTAIATTAVLAITAILVSLPFVVEDWFDVTYWRVTLALAILATTGTLIIPLINALTRPASSYMYNPQNMQQPVYTPPPAPPVMPHQQVQPVQQVQPAMPAYVEPVQQQQLPVLYDELGYVFDLNSDRPRPPVLYDATGKPYVYSPPVTQAPQPPQYHLNYGNEHGGSPEGYQQ